MAFINVRPPPPPSPPLPRPLTPLPPPPSRAQNFSSSFRHWDRLLGTDTKYHAYRARIDSAKTQAARERVRKVEDEKAEAEGVVLANETIARAT